MKRAPGRPPALDAEQITRIRRLRDSGRSWRQIESETGCKRSTARRAASPEEWDRNRLSSREYTLRKYGLTEESFAALLASQSGLCSICEKSLDGDCNIDHDHVTKCVRELLCRGCNVGLGSFRDNPLWMRRAASYVERHRQTPPA
jgi:hypothetical protein